MSGRDGWPGRFDQQGQTVYGSQTNIGEAKAPVLSGQFQGPVNIYQVTPEKLVIPRQIPLPPADFTGRDEELQNLVSSFKSGATGISLHGMGGVGKTALAFALAERIKDSFPDGHLFINMRGTDITPLSFAEAMAQVIRSYAPTLRLPESEAELANLYRSVLDGKSALLLLDNALDDRQVRPLLPPAKCSLIVTSRRKFKLPGMIAKDLEVLKLDKAVELLLKMASLDSSNAKHQKDNPWEELARLCGCLPVALRAAGSFLANTPDSSPEQYVRELRDEHMRLKRIGKEGVEEDLDLKLSLSYRSLMPETSRVFGILSIFPADFDAAAEETVCQDEGHRHLSELVRWSLVEFQRASTADLGRYHLHDLVRLFAAKMLNEEDKEVAKSTALRRHAEHYVNVLRIANKLCTQGGDALLAGLKLFGSEWENINAGQVWVENVALQPGKVTFAEDSEQERVLRLANEYPGAGAFVLYLRLNPNELIHWLETAITAARKLKDFSSERRHMGNLATAYSRVGDDRKAIEILELLLEIFRDTGDRQLEGMTLTNLGSAYLGLGDAHKAIEFFEQRLKINREIESSRKGSDSLYNMGNAYYLLGDDLKAIEFFEQSLNVAREIRDLFLEGNILWNMSLALDRLGKKTEAIDHAKSALVIYEKIENPLAERVRQALAEWQGQTKTP